MADFMTPEQRHRCMSNIHSRNTKPEIQVRKELFRLGFRYRVNVKNLYGHPDIVLPKFKTAIFVNGCFWHGHENCKKSNIPKTNTDFWKDKIIYNQKRDKDNISKLQGEGWNVIVVWECELSKARFDDTIARIVESFPKFE